MRCTSTEQGSGGRDGERVARRPEGQPGHDIEYKGEQAMGGE